MASEGDLPTLRIAKHRALVEADTGAAAAFKRFVFAGYADHEACLEEVVRLGTNVRPSLAVLSAALLAGTPLGVVLATSRTDVDVHTGRYRLGKLFGAVTRNGLSLSDDEITLLFDLAAKAGWDGDQIAELATRQCEKITDLDRLAGLAPTLLAAFAQVDSPNAGPTDRALRRRLRALVGAASPQPDREEIDLSPILLGDRWGRAVVERLPVEITDPTLASLALGHLADATTGTMPSKTWTKKWHQLKAGGSDAEAVASILIDAFVSAEAVGAGDERRSSNDVLMKESNSDTLRGAVWALIDRGDASAPSLLGAIAARSYRETWRRTPNDKVANACIAGLGAIGSPAAIHELRQLRDAIKQQGVRKQVAKALTAAAASAGIRTTRLAEGSVADFGLDESARRTTREGAFVAGLSINDRDKAVIEWYPHGADADDADLAEVKPTRTVPAEVVTQHPERVDALKAELKDLTKTLTVERLRLESLLGENESWSFDHWATAYWRHPVTGHFARRLAWRVRPEHDSDEFIGFAIDEPSSFIDQAGTPRRVSSSKATIRPWHPVQSDVADIFAVRRLIAERKIRQPFKQAYREVYLLTPAEEDTNVYSNRFAGHVLRYQQVFALMKERGWATNYLGSWEAGNAGCAKRTFDDDRVTAQFFHDSIDPGQAPHIDLCSTDQVRFIRTGDRAALPLPLADVDPVVFSEAMRDVDLFVGVCSIGNDPAWQDHGEQRHYEYWADYAFGELGSSAEIRREVLQEIIPKLKIADRFELDDRNLVVRGDIGTYRIHLGSGNVMMDPGRYLCIVSGRGGPKAGSVFLPFEDDAVLSLVLSKAFLLAADTKITGPTILRQIGVR